ncbi:hypothetical protein, partial [Microcoleus sp. herbarium5]|uniref:hypothetical protein n=1 Tax=Microcoleus sp. herbarium5 TaxID=3055434 RepID=UPI002FD2B8B7
MTEIYAKSETHAARGKEGDERLRSDADSREDARRISTGTGAERFQPDREGGKEGNILGYAVGGMLDQLIDDAE